MDTWSLKYVWSFGWGSEIFGCLHMPWAFWKKMRGSSAPRDFKNQGNVCAIACKWTVMLILSCIIQIILNDMFFMKFIGQPAVGNSMAAVFFKKLSLENKCQHNFIFKRSFRIKQEYCMWDIFSYVFLPQEKILVQ